MRWRPAELGATDGIVLWIEHLLFCLAQGAAIAGCLGARIRRGTLPDSMRRRPSVSWCA
ncbi:hypothetical protein O0544_03360 [Edwardsiella anguillarum]|nr:hypothetical protein [Edwardsiella anguillarum]